MNPVYHTRAEWMVLKVSYWLEVVGAWWAMGSDVLSSWVERRFHKRWRLANPEEAKKQDEFHRMMMSMMNDRRKAMGMGMLEALTTHYPKGGDTVRIPKLGTITSGALSE